MKKLYMKEAILSGWLILQFVAPDVYLHSVCFQVYSEFHSKKYSYWNSKEQKRKKKEIRYIRQKK